MKFDEMRKVERDGSRDVNSLRSNSTGIAAELFHNRFRGWGKNLPNHDAAQERLVLFRNSTSVDNGTKFH